MAQSNSEKLALMLSRTPKKISEWDRVKASCFKVEYLEAKKALTSKNHDKINYYCHQMGFYYD
jgi:hypothetical protein